MHTGTGPVGHGSNVVLPCCAVLWRGVQVDFVPTYLAELAFWPVVQTLNFSKASTPAAGRRHALLPGLVVTGTFACLLACMHALVRFVLWGGPHCTAGCGRQRVANGGSLCALTVWCCVLCGGLGCVCCAGPGAPPAVGGQHVFTAGCCIHKLGGKPVRLTNNSGAAVGLGLVAAVAGWSWLQLLMLAAAAAGTEMARCLQHTPWCWMSGGAVCVTHT